MSVDNEKRIASGDTRASSQSLGFAEPGPVAVAAPSAGEALPAEAALPPKAEWPGCNMPKFGWWAGAYSIAFTVVGFFYFAFTAQHHPWRALIAAVLLPL